MAETRRQREQEDARLEAVAAASRDADRFLAWWNEQYQKLARAGASVADLAAALGVHPEPHQPVKRKVIVPDEVDVTDIEEEAEMRATENDDPVVENVPDVPVEASEHLGGEFAPETGLVSTVPDHSGQVPPDPSVVRAWAKAAAVPVNPRGRVSRSVVDAYLAAHTSAAQPETEEETSAEGTSTVEDEAMRHPTVEDLTAQLAAAHVALEFVLRAWAGEKTRRAAQERLVFHLSEQVNALQVAARADGDLILSMDHALIAADVHVAQLTRAAQRRPWYRRRTP